MFFQLPFQIKLFYLFVLLNLVVIQHYDIDASKEYVIRGNAGIVKCQLPSFVADYLSIVAWETDLNETFRAKDESYGRIRKVPKI